MIMAAARGNAKADARCTILVNPPPSTRNQPSPYITPDQLIHIHSPRSDTKTITWSPRQNQSRSTRLTSLSKTVNRLLRLVTGPLYLHSPALRHYGGSSCGISSANTERILELVH
ncbi:hypothetical protein PEBR_30899 [Penicillium brasilianum]|uniref:Uncharacterized protein n=1 Tax=Penicillium brasilianum TaxID=104259 RepID=A0A1S9RHJ7_PENBI|nr:hypothetical protein PEBR_30899 [Penicillium brasilianum]